MPAVPLPKGKFPPSTRVLLWVISAAVGVFGTTIVFAKPEKIEPEFDVRLVRKDIEYIKEDLHDLHARVEKMGDRVDEIKIILMRGK